MARCCHYASQEWDRENRISVKNAVKNAAVSHEILTGLLYIDTKTHDLQHIINTADVPLNKLAKDVLCPGSAALKNVNDGLR